MEVKKYDVGTYFDEGCGAIGQQQCAQLTALSLILIFANSLDEITKTKFSIQ